MKKIHKVKKEEIIKMQSEAIQIQIPSDLFNKIKNQISYYEEVLSKIVTEKLNSLINKKEMDTKEQHMLSLFRDNNLVISSNRQKDMAKNIISSLNISDIPDRSAVRSSFSKLEVSLSEEVLRMRGQ